MALFPNDELVDISANGRTLRVPASVARAMVLPQAAPPQPQQISPGIAAEEEAAAPQPETPVLPAAGKLEQTGVDSMGNPMLAAVPEPAPAAQPFVGADYQVKTAAPAAPVKSSKNNVKSAAANQPQPAVTGQVATAKNEGDEARAQQAQAIYDESNLQAAGQTMIGNEYARRNAEIDKLMAKRAADMEKAAQEEASKMTEAETMKKKIAGTKIDRSIDHPILAAISIALGGIGTAMNKGDVNQNPAWNALWQVIDRKVAGQMADLDQLKTVYGMTKDEIGQIREKWSNKLAMHNMLVAAETDKAVRTIEEMTARTNSETLKANGMKLIGELKERGAAATMDAVKFQMQFDESKRQHQAQIGLGYRQLGETIRSNRAQEQLKREDMYLDMQKALAAEEAKRGAEAAKAKAALMNDNETRGIRNTVTGEALLTAKGRKMMQQAEGLAQTADAIKKMPNATPEQLAKAKALEDQAAVLRGDAQITEMVRHRDPTQAGRLSDQYASVQTMASVIDRINTIYNSPDGGKSYLSTSDGQAEIKSLLVQATMQAKNAWQLGVMSKQDAQMVGDALLGDRKSPIDGWTLGNLSEGLVGTDPNAFKRTLESVLNTSEEEVWHKLRGTNFGGTKDDLFFRRTEPVKTPESKAAEKVLQGHTVGEEAASQAGASTARKVVNRVIYDAGTSNEERVRNIENSGSLKYPGFSKDQGEAMDTLFRAYKSGDPKAKERAATRLIEQAKSSRRDLALSTFHALRENAPELYEAAKAQIGTDPGTDEAPTVYSQLQYEEGVRKNIGGARESAARAAMSGESNLELAQKAIIGNQESFNELSKRAGAGDKEAVKALSGVINARKRQGMQ